MDQDTLQVPFLAGSMADDAFVSESHPSSTPTGALSHAVPPTSTPALYQASINCSCSALAASLLISSSVPALCMLGYAPESTPLCSCSCQQGYLVEVYTYIRLIAY